VVECGGLIRVVRFRVGYLKISKKKFEVDSADISTNASTNNSEKVTLYVRTNHDRHSVVHKDDVELVAHRHHHLYCLLSILSYRGFYACVCVCVCKIV
jgi:hypothetical protein